MVTLDTLRAERREEILRLAEQRGARSLRVFGSVAPLVCARPDPSRGYPAVKDDRLYLHHMLERCHRITRFIGPGRERFLASEELQDAVIRNVEVIARLPNEAACRRSIGRRSAECATS